MERKTLAIVVIFLSIIPAGSALSSSGCNMFNAQLIGNPVKTAVSGNGNTIVIGGIDGIIGIFTFNGSPRLVYRTNDNITGIAVSRDSSLIAATSYNGDLFYFDGDGNLLWNVSGFGCNSRVGLSDDGQSGYVFSDGQSGDLTRDTVFHFYSNGTILSHMSVPFISNEAMSSDGSMAVIGTRGSYGNNYVVGLDKAGIRWEKKIPQEWGISDVAISDDGNTIAAIEPVLFCFQPIGKHTLERLTGISGTKCGCISGREIRCSGNTIQDPVLQQIRYRLWDYTLPDYINHIRYLRRRSENCSYIREYHVLS